MDNCPCLMFSYLKVLKKNIKKNDFFIFDYMMKNIKQKLNII